MKQFILCTVNLIVSITNLFACFPCFNHFADVFLTILAFTKRTQRGQHDKRKGKNDQEEEAKSTCIQLNEYVF